MFALGFKSKITT